MKRSFLQWILWGCLLMSGSAFGQIRHAEKIYRKVNDSVIRIYSTDPGTVNLRAQGSGVILKDKGWIVTNHHLMIQGAMLYALRGDVYIPLDSIVASDPQRDILVLQIANTEEARALTAKSGLKTGNSDDLRPGQRIYAIGNPLNFENTISEGIVSGLRSSMKTGQTLIQISAPISQGSSGGAVVDAKGRLVGISTLVMSGEATQNLNFAVSINDVLGVATGTLKGLTDSTQYYVSQYFEQGNQAMRERAFDKAIASYTLALDRMEYGDPSVICFRMGQAYQALGMLDEAGEYFRAVRMGPQYVDAQMALGLVYNAQKKYRSGIGVFEKVLAMSPYTYRALYGLAESYYGLKQYDVAVEYITKMLKYKYTSGESLMLMGNIAVETGLPDNAIYFYLKALDEDPTLGKAHGLLSFLYAEKGDDVNAAYHLECAKELGYE